MKKSNYYLIVMLSIMGLLTMGSCSLIEQDPCADITCENGGSCDEGICDCPVGTIGTNCENFDASQVQALLANHAPIDLVNGGVPVDSLYGKMYEDGFIFYLNTDDGTGMVANKSDQDMGNKAEWGCGTKLINGADGKTVGTGAQNTADILAGCSEVGIAAKLCRDKGEDWFLPSKDELNLMYTNLHANGYGGFAADWYWSSSESGDASAWIQKFVVGDGLPSFYFKIDVNHVRAARLF